MGRKWDVDARYGEKYAEVSRSEVTVTGMPSERTVVLERFKLAKQLAPYRSTADATTAP